MRKCFLTGMLLVGWVAVSVPVARAQKFQAASTDVAATFSLQQGSVVPSGGNFWLKGGSLDSAFTFAHGVGLAINITGYVPSSIAPGAKLGTATAVIGPRYTYRVGGTHQARIFGEVLAGVVLGYASVFPIAGGVSDHANSFALQAGGGVDIALTRHWAVRAIEVNYIRTQLPNGASNTQDEMRLAAGITYHIGK